MMGENGEKKEIQYLLQTIKILMEEKRRCI